MRFWAEAQPHEHGFCPLSTEKVTVWCAIVRSGIIGPYWFEDEHRRPVTINTEHYVEMMMRKFIPALRRKQGVDMNTDLSAGWRNPTLLECFTGIPPAVFPWGQAYLTLNRQPMAGTLP